MTETPAADGPAKTSRQSLFLMGGVSLVAVVIAVGAAIFLLGGGDDEQEVKGTCRGATWELNAERDNDEGNRMTASLDINAASSGEAWKVSITSNGRSVFDRTVTSDDEGEIEASALLGTGEEAQDVKAEFSPASGTGCSAGVRLG